MVMVDQMARWVTDFDVAAIPEPVLEKARLHLLDSLGCALAALDDPAALGVLHVAESLGGAPECTLIGSAVRTSVVNAVLANGTLVRSLDLNDAAQHHGIAHPSDNIPVALAVGERENATGRDVLGAIVLGYELLLRVPRSHLRPNPWDRTSHSSLAAAAMAGKLMRLPPGQLAEALALSVSHANVLSSVRRGQLSTAKSLANSTVAQVAVISALLASAGATGPRTALEDWAEGAMGGADLSPLLAPQPATHYRIMDCELKAHPCVIFAQTAVEAALQIYPQLNGHMITRVEARIADDPTMVTMTGDTDRGSPATKETADHSFSFVIAITLLEGELSLAQYEGQRWLDPTVRDLMGHITFTPDPSLNRHLPAYPIALRVTLDDGQAQEAEVPYAPGQLKRPMSPEEVSAKFHRFAAPHLPPDRRRAVIEAVSNLAQEIGRASCRERVYVLV